MSSLGVCGWGGGVGVTGAAQKTFSVRSLQTCRVVVVIINGHFLFDVFFHLMRHYLRLRACTVRASPVTEANDTGKMKRA